MRNSFVVDAAKRRIDKLNADMMDAYSYAFFNKLPEPKGIFAMPGKVWDLPKVEMRQPLGRMIGYDGSGMARIIIGNIEGEKMSQPMSPVVEKLVSYAEQTGRLSERVNHQGEHLRQDQDVIEELQRKVGRLENDMQYVVRERDDFRKAYYEAHDQLQTKLRKETAAKEKAKKAAAKAKKTTKKSK